MRPTLPVFPAKARAGAHRIWRTGGAGSPFQKLVSVGQNVTDLGFHRSQPFAVRKVGREV